MSSTTEATEAATLRLEPVGEICGLDADELRLMALSTMHSVSGIAVDVSLVRKINMDGFMAISSIKQLCEENKKQFSVVGVGDSLNDFFTLFSLVFHGCEDYFGIGKQR